MIEVFTRLRDLLDHRERRNACILFVMMLAMGLLEAVGIASVMPFVSVLSNPDIVNENEYLSAINGFFGFESQRAFLLFLGAAVFVLVVGSLVFKALTHWAMARFAHMRNYSISTRLLRRYLGRPYTWYLNQNTADLGKSLLSEVGQVTNGVLLPALQFVANAIVAVFIVGLVVAVEPVIALLAFGVLGGAYTILYLAIRPYLSRIGAERVRANRRRFQVAQEAMGGIKEVKVGGLENGYVRSFHRPAYRFARTQANNQIAGEIPKFLFQAIAFGGMLAVLMVLLAMRGGDLNAVLPTIALFGFAASRLNPALQLTYKSLTKLRFGKPALDHLHSDLIDPATGMVGRDATDQGQQSTSTPIRLSDEIRLESVTYTYPGAERPALDDLSLTIPAHTTIGLVGSTGAGKTSVVDVILGLLEPQQGAVQVDGITLASKNLRDWQRNIGYVPQHIFLTDDTVSANIAFGVPASEIDPTRVERAAKLAELHDFIVNEMAYGYETVVGERGVRLSGGQRQRIGIARALYHDPDLVVMDEATSALDSMTEKAVMQAIHNLEHDKTIILIAHRLTTVQECDRIFVLDRGQAVDEGTYAELHAGNTRFREMAATGG